MVAAVAVGSLLPGTVVPSAVGGPVEHWIAYSGLTFLPFVFARRLRTAWAIAWALLSMGTALEIAQIFVRGRAFEWVDLGLNACGVMTGVLAGRRLRGIASEPPPHRFPQSPCSGGLSAPEGSGSP